MKAQCVFMLEVGPVYTKEMFNGFKERIRQDDINIDFLLRAFNEFSNFKNVICYDIFQKALGDGALSKEDFEEALQSNEKILDIIRKSLKIKENNEQTRRTF